MSGAGYVKEEGRALVSTTPPLATYLNDAKTPAIEATAAIAAITSSATTTKGMEPERELVEVEALADVRHADALMVAVRLRHEQVTHWARAHALRH